MPLMSKICGMRDQAALDCAAEAGAALCGFIFAPESPRAITPEQAAALDSQGMLRVGVFVTDDVDAILKAVAVARLDRVQLHGQHSTESLKRLALALGPERLIRVFWPRRYADRAGLEEDLLRWAPSVGMFLLDAGLSGGGSGDRLDAAWLRGLRSPRPWLLAGGLNPENVVAAVGACTPDGVDFNSGLESAPGQKDLARIRAALAALREAS